jgi:hypothetical protein
MHFLDIWHTVTIERFQLAQKFMLALQDRHAIGRASFSIKVSSYLYQFILDSITDSDLFLTKSLACGKKIILRQGEECTPVSVTSKKDVWELQLPNIEMLKPILGNDYWNFPIGRIFGYGASHQRIQNYIVPVDSEIFLVYDRCSSYLTVTFKVASGNSNLAINDMNQSLKMEQVRLEGKLLNDLNRIIAVEMNSTDFTQNQKHKKSKRVKNTTTMVAWAIDDGELLF